LVWAQVVQDGWAEAEGGVMGEGRPNTAWVAESLARVEYPR